MTEGEEQAEAEQRVLDDLARTTIRLIVAEPFFGHYFVGLNKRVGEIETDLAIAMGRSGPELVVGGPAWEAMSQEQRYGAIKHEVLHLLFKHPLRALDYGDASRFHLAADLVVTQHLTAPQRRARDVGPAHLGLEEDQTADAYYHALADCREEAADVLDPDHPLQLRHRTWSELDGRCRSEVERSLIEGTLDDHLEAVIQRVGLEAAPRSLTELLDAFLAGRRPTLDWRRVLRSFVARAQHTQLQSTMARPSKRYGTFPGTKVRPKQHIVTVVDTSGSVDGDALRLFFAEIHQIARFAEVTVVECDDEVRAVYPYRGAPPREVHGRGGTDLSLPLELANGRLDPDALIYLTDGCADAPRVAPRYPVLWVVLATDLDHCRDLPGRTVLMRDRARP